ncbi:hypothetical protein BB559_001387 [Furculomyces boomerangus]|uniref:W2 domain-containing protein n=2 Tax=Harpellales TaxID=61421 RepID=A0A2T9Z236_9FUNG|nr:hypothetical protein BB559_001387 [Furculomyces boomerangus]PVZ98532.1 hypothetical protein BB558_005449 [Smittium angustum]
MSLINIRRDVQDSFYRYKMPKLQSKFEGKGNGKKTVIPNMIEISQALSRPPSYPTKYFGTVLGAQVQIEEKNDRYIVNGAHEAAKLQDILDGFIEKFVLCGSCKSPETDLIIKDSIIIKNCMACGKRTDVDMRHRLSTYILKNPPPKNKKAGQHAAPDPTTGAGIIESRNGSDDDDEFANQLAEDAAKLNIADEDSDKWDIDADISEEAVARRQRALAGGFNGVDGNDEESDGPYDQLGDFISTGENLTDKEIFNKAKDLGLSKKHRALIVIVQCLFKEKDILSQITNHAQLLISFGNSEKHQKAILGSFEKLVSEIFPSLLPKTGHIFKALYENDIIEEDAFLAWNEKPSKKYTTRENSKKVHEAAARFIQWIREAEEEDSDEDSDEDSE